MSTIAQGLTVTAPDSPRGVVRTVLVVDDSRAQRFILASYLRRLGLTVIEAGSGAEALTLCDTQRIDLIVSDWMMPGMDGLTLCRELRARKFEHYVYFILLTSKSEKVDIAQGLDTGADDFLTKPIGLDELRARISAGERIMRMERELTENHRLVSATLDEIKTLYDALDRDLTEARKLQQSLIRERRRTLAEGEINLMLRPCGHVGGDLVGFYRIGDGGLGVFAIDVSGHGIASALLTARVAAYLSGNSPGQNVALGYDSRGRIIGHPPETVMDRLNTMMLNDIETEHYFTMVLAHITLATGHVQMVQAGHPTPMLQSADGSITEAGDGGMPVGLIEGATWDRQDFRLEPGQRLLVFSDGFSECVDPSGRQLDDNGMIDLMYRNRALQGSAFLEGMVWDLVAFSGEQDFTDDVSALLFEYSGPEQVG